MTCGDVSYIDCKNIALWHITELKKADRQATDKLRYRKQAILETVNAVFVSAALSSLDTLVKFVPFPVHLQVDIAISLNVRCVSSMGLYNDELSLAVAALTSEHNTWSESDRQLSVC